MVVVIFRAKVKKLDDEYYRYAEQLRQKACSEYGCLDFISTTEGDEELALSYWRSEMDIQRWRQDVEHLAAQGLGQSKWYESYSVEVASISRIYRR